MPDFTSYSSGFGTIHLLAKTIHLVSVLVSVFKPRRPQAKTLCNSLMMKHERWDRNRTKLTDSESRKLAGFVGSSRRIWPNSRGTFPNSVSASTDGFYRESPFTGHWGIMVFRAGSVVRSIQKPPVSQSLFAGRQFLATALSVTPPDGLTTNVIQSRKLTFCAAAKSLHESTPSTGLDRPGPAGR
jgi:hypothetical protein